MVRKADLINKGKNHTLYSWLPVQLDLNKQKYYCYWVAAKNKWILFSYHPEAPGLNHLCFYQFLKLCNMKWTKRNKHEVGIGPYVFKNM